MPEIDLSTFTPVSTEGHSSKGNQPKWYADGYWYKADYMGYESLSEVVVSRLLEHSNLQDFISYEPVFIRRQGQTSIGCRSRSFQQANEMLVPLERLHRAFRGRSLAEHLATLADVSGRISYTVSFVEQVTGLGGFGAYLCELLELDAFLLNEDRHTNNIAVLRNEETGAFRLCPIFDNGLSLLSDLHDYPISADLYACIDRVKAKPFSADFSEQAEAATALFGSRLHFSLSRKDASELFEQLKPYYDENTMNRAERVLMEQMRRYKYLF